MKLLFLNKKIIIIDNFIWFYLKMNNSYHLLITACVPGIELSTLRESCHLIFMIPSEVVS